MNRQRARREKKTNIFGRIGTFRFGAHLQHRYIRVGRRAAGQAFGPDIRRCRKTLRIYMRNHTDRWLIRYNTRTNGTHTRKLDHHITYGRFFSLLLFVCDFFSLVWIQILRIKHKRILYRIHRKRMGKKKEKHTQTDTRTLSFHASTFKIDQPFAWMEFTWYLLLFTVQVAKWRNTKLVCTSKTRRVANLYNWRVCSFVWSHKTLFL